jgi:hypothetical protein
METATQQNIQEIARIEKEALHRRSAGERLGDLVATQAGRMWFILLTRSGSFFGSGGIQDGDRELEGLILFRLHC